MKILISTVIILFTFQISLAQRSDSYADLVESVMPSIVVINTYDAAGNALKSGTGFCVGPSLFITNFHVVADASRITIRTSNNRIYPVTYDVTDENADLALLKAETKIYIKELQFASILPKVGEKIIVVGNPLGLTGTVSDGIVSAIRDSDEEFIQITAPISSGSSGSPVINFNGDVIGIATMNLVGGQNLNFAISSRYIKTLWSSKFPVLNVSSKRPLKIQRSSRWRWLDGSETTYDKQSLFRKGDIVSVWLKYEEKQGAYIKIFNELDCSIRRIRSIQSILYDKESNVISSSYIAEDWQAIIPDSMGEEYFDVFCDEKPDYQFSLEQSELMEAAREYERQNNLSAAIPVYWKVLRSSYDVKYKKHGLEELSNSFDQRGASSGLVDIYEKQFDVRGLERLYNYEISKGKVERYSDLASLYKKHKMIAKFRSTVFVGIKFVEGIISSAKIDYSEFHTLSELYILNNQSKKAITLLNNGLDRFPNDVILLSDLGNIYNKERLWKESVNLIENAISNLPNLDKFYLELLLPVLKKAYEGLGDSKNVARIDAEIKVLK